VERVSLLAVLLAAVLVLCGHPAAGKPPERLSDQDFWALTQSLSEPSRVFNHLEGLVSNEQMLRYLVGALRQSRPPGVLIGVGPEQNFSYIAAAEPKMAFIVDIRREIRNLHLVYKALFELSKTRSEFLGRLFARQGPKGSSAREMLDNLMALPSDSTRFERTLADIRQILQGRHKFPLTDQDLRDIVHILTAFLTAGPRINWWGDTGHQNVDFKSLNAMESVGDIGVSFLGSEGSFQIVKSLHARNLIIPIVGDFAGEKALRGISAYIRKHHEAVGVFYGSNVDGFLTPEELHAFCANLADMPVGPRSIYIGGDGGKLAGVHLFPAALTMCAALAP
jgi:hypothetical protein